MPKRKAGADCTQGMSEKDRTRLFAALKDIAEKCKGMGMKNNICDQVKKKSFKNEKNKKNKFDGLKSLPSTSFISSSSRKR